MSTDLHLIEPAELGRILGVKTTQVMEWRRQFDWPHVRVGRRIRWTPEQVEQIIARHSQAGTKPQPKSDGRTNRSARRS